MNQPPSALLAVKFGMVCVRGGAVGQGCSLRPGASHIEKALPVIFGLGGTRPAETFFGVLAALF